MLTVNDIKDHRYSKGDFVFFWGHTGQHSEGVGKQCLSQWYMAHMTIDGVYYNCMEQYLMAEKARTFGDYDTEALIMAEYNQMAIKKLGRLVEGYDDEIWKADRQEFSVRGNIYKFAQNPKLKYFLLSTGNKIIVEASPKDRIWGIGLDENHPDAIVPARWQGENLLGFALMEVREHLRRIESKLNEIISKKEDDDPWPPKDFIEFCAGHKFTTMLQWECERGLFEGIKDAILSSDAVNADKIMIDMQYGPGFGFLPFMFFEQLHEVLDPVAKECHFDYIFSLTPEPKMAKDGRKVNLTLFA